MYAIEFQTTVNADGSIAIPSIYRPRIQGPIRVIILAHESRSQPSIIDDLLAAPRPVPGFTPLARDVIYDRSITIQNPLR